MALVIIAALVLYFHLKFSERTSEFAPTILTTAGIFATFLGIALGLLNFDSANIQSSVPELLEGLKTAFWASVFGVGGALSLKIRQFFALSQIKEDVSIQDATAGDVLLAIRQIGVHLKDTKASDEMLSQIKMLRQDNNDRLDLLRATQENALKQLSEMSSKTLIEALRDVVKDFNSKINEQFGSNFKELNEAVGALLVWQRQYREHLIIITEQNESLCEKMHMATHNFEVLVGQSSAFVQVAESLNSTVTELQSQQSNLEAMLRNFAVAVQQAANGLPALEQKIMELTDQVLWTIKENREQITGIIDDFNDHARGVIEKTSRQNQEFNASVERSVNDSLRGLGTNLAAMTEKFARDYGHLADALQKISAMTRNSL